MRVVSGIYKGRRFDVPHSFKARPTTDFAKENLFNILSNLIDFENQVQALDLFAGTGSISLELISRGCEQVVSIDALPNLASLPDLIIDNQLLKENGLFILEHGKDYQFEQHPNFMQHRSYGAVNFSFFTPTIKAVETSVG